MKTIVLFTEAFPYTDATEAVFLKPELDALSQLPQTRIILVPSVERTPSVDLSAYPNVEVCRLWLEHPLWSHRWLRAPLALTTDVARAVRGVPAKSTLTYATSAKAAETALGRWIDAAGFDLDNTLFYTFWFDYVTVGLSLAARRRPLRIITRCHGHDVFEQRAETMRVEAASRLQHIYPASEASREHLLHIGIPAYKVTTALMGSLKPEHAPQLAEHHTKEQRHLTFITAARVDPGKQHQRMLEMLRALAVARTDTTVEWLVVGDGQLMHNLRQEVERAAAATPNLKVELLGMLPNSQVHALYASRPIDWCLLATDTEGGFPIALSEAMSYGVPLAATLVEGVADILDDDIGMPMPPDITNEEFVRGLAPFLDLPVRYAMLSSNAYNRWARDIDAHATRAVFAREITRYFN